MPPRSSSPARRCRPRWRRSASPSRSERLRDAAEALRRTPPTCSSPRSARRPSHARRVAFAARFVRSRRHRGDRRIPAPPPARSHYALSRESAAELVCLCSTTRAPGTCASFRARAEAGGRHVHLMLAGPARRTTRLRGARRASTGFIFAGGDAVAILRGACWPRRARRCEQRAALGRWLKEQFRWVRFRFHFHCRSPPAAGRRLPLPPRKLVDARGRSGEVAL